MIKQEVIGLLTSAIITKQEGIGLSSSNRCTWLWVVCASEDILDKLTKNAARIKTICLCEHVPTIMIKQGVIGFSISNCNHD